MVLINKWNEWNDEMGFIFILLVLIYFILLALMGCLYFKITNMNLMSRKENLGRQMN